MRRKVRHGGTLGRGRWLLGKKRTTNHRQTRTGADAREVESINDISMGGALLLGAAGFALLHGVRSSDDGVLRLRALRYRLGRASGGETENKGYRREEGGKGEEGGEGRGTLISVDLEVSEKRMETHGGSSV